MSPGACLTCTSRQAPPPHLTRGRDRDSLPIWRLSGRCYTSYPPGSGRRMDGSWSGKQIARATGYVTPSSLCTESCYEKLQMTIMCNIVLDTCPSIWYNRISGTWDSECLGELGSLLPDIDKGGAHHQPGQGPPLPHSSQAFAAQQRFRDRTRRETALVQAPTMHSQSRACDPRR